MSNLTEKFQKLGIENAPGQEKMQKKAEIELLGEKLEGDAVDFSHGDVDAFLPIPGAFEAFENGYREGGKQAYTEYRGREKLRREVAEKLSAYTGREIDPAENIILTPGTQGALFLAMGALAGNGDKVAIVEPDYFANRKIVEFLEGEVVPISMKYETCKEGAGIDLEQLEKAFRNGVKVFLFSNPNNPTGVIYSEQEIKSIAALADQYGVALIVDELYSRLIYDNRKYTHLCALEEAPKQLITVIGPSKTESLSGFRLGAAFGTAEIIARMEKLQAIVSLRAAGYCQAVFSTWFSEPAGFMEQRIAKHAQIRDRLLQKLEKVTGVEARKTEAGSYLFVKMPELTVGIKEFCKAARELAGVTVTPGTEFGPEFTRHFRINFSQDEEKAAAALDRLLAVMERYRKQ